MIDKKTKKFYGILFTVVLIVMITIYIPAKMHGLDSLGLDPFVFAMIALSVLVFVLGYSIYYFVSSYRDETRAIDNILHDYTVRNPDLDKEKDHK